MFWFVTVIIFLVICLQTPVLVDVLRVAFPQLRISRLTSRAANFLLTLLLSLLFLVGLGYQFFVFLPYLADDPNPLTTVKGVAHALFAGWVWTNMVVNYYLAVYTHTGCEPEPEPFISNESEEGAPAADSNAGKSLDGSKEDGGVVKTDETLRQRVVGDVSAETKPELPSVVHTMAPAVPLFPKNGLDWKPKRSHFCKLCGYRVSYMDHHCPFTANCVGRRNFSHFYLWLFYMTLGLGYAIWVVFPYFNQCTLANVRAYLGYGIPEKNELCKILGGHSDIVIPIIGGFWVCWNMFWLQTLLLLVDLSTYNVLTNIMKFPVLRFAWQRLRSWKFLEPDSRLNVLLLSQRPSVFLFLFPVTNSH